jgi:hypothetical protein
MSKSRSKNVKRMKKLLALKKLKEREIRRNIINEKFDDFLLRNGLDRSKMTHDELSLAKSIMKAQIECPYT